MAERIHVGGDAARHVQAYLEYEQIVGTDDGGKMMSEQEFEEYKASVREKRANRLYTNWRNMETGADCKAIGPASQCFCGHRYKEHNFDNVYDKNVSCKDKRCKCKLFSYIPIFGSQDFKCKGCKHSCHEHLPVSRKCTRPSCKCGVFNSTHACSCGMGYNVHDTVFESRAEREAEGRQVDAAWLQADNMVGGMGGLGHQDFSSLADDQDRRDMMNPGAILGNMESAGQIMGSGMQMQAIGAGSQGGQQRRAIGHGGGAGQQNQLVPANMGGGGPSLLDLFNTPHSYGGGVGGLTGQMKKLKM